MHSASSRCNSISKNHSMYNARNKTERLCKWLSCAEHYLTRGGWWGWSKLEEHNTSCYLSLPRMRHSHQQNSTQTLSWVGVTTQQIFSFERSSSPRWLWILFYPARIQKSFSPCAAHIKLITEIHPKQGQSVQTRGSPIHCVCHNSKTN